ncbi:MAG: cell division protein FtsQ [Solirubrobacteraceae bacterium]|nr:cell division protein FtsQ [Solirubrobacteraceae bacterium]
MPSLASRRLRVVLGIVVLAVMVGSVGLWLRSSSLVRVEAVTVTGIEGPQATEIRRALTVAARDMTTLAVDDGALRHAVSTYPVVRSLRTSTGFPHRLRIAVNAYDAVAALKPGGGAATAVAGDGTLLRGVTTQGLALVGVKTLPGGDRVADPAALRAIRLLAAAPAPLRARVQRVFRGSRGMAATVVDGPKLYFGGTERLRAKWSAAARVLASERAQGASYVDVRIPERPVAGGFTPRVGQPSPSTLG